ncbi:MAG: hypothetical protein A2096_05940 [Spirochaetes bacterium GWF1_41_5]|nr:MAG: hypothetical protein A2096_05940 [Spirochaetes bacterium GWF1_41_5]HBE02676.1 molybdopterin oxidoreductase [Spirochaetia bacterium]
MKEITFTCIVCPQGCHLTACRNSDTAGWSVQGNRCVRGRDYAVSEMTEPRRTVTAVVRTDSVYLPYAPVRTDQPLRREMVFQLLEAVYALKVKSPFRAGDVIIKDFKGTGVNVLLTRTDEPHSVFFPTALLPELM